MSDATTNAPVKVVTAVFEDSSGVERAYDAAVANGYDKDDINIIMSDDTRRRYYADNRDVDTDFAKKTAEGGELGGPTGMHVGLAIPVVAAVAAALVIPGLGLVAAGPIAVALAGAGAAGVAAGLIGLLADWGVPKERVREYESAIHDGAILVAVKTQSEEDARRIEQSWKALGARFVHA